MGGFLDWFCGIGGIVAFAVKFAMFGGVFRCGFRLWVVWFWFWGCLGFGCWCVRDGGCGVYGSWLWVTPYLVLELCGLPFDVGCFLLYFAMCFVSVVRCCTSSLLGLLCLHEVVFYGSINSVVV